MRFIVRLPNIGPTSSLQSIRKVALEADSEGFYGVSVGDRMVWTRGQNRTYIICSSAEAIEKNPRPDVYDSLVTLSYVAAITKSVKLLTSVYILVLRHPIVVARETASLDELSGGRLIFGIGVGGAFLPPNVFDIVGVPYSERGRITDEYISVLRAAWTNDIISFEGKYTRFQDAEIYPKPRQKGGPPIWIGGTTLSALKRVSKLGDGWIPTYASPFEVQETARRLAVFAEKHGRSRREFEITPTVYVNISRNEGQAEKNTAATFEALSRGKIYSDHFKSFDKIKLRNLVGTPTEIIRKVEEYDRSGAHHLELKFIHSSLDEVLEMLKLFSREVFPSFSR